jgi:hypothetical protein
MHVPGLIHSGSTGSLRRAALSTVLGVIMVLSAAACGGGGSKTTSAAGGDAPSTSTSSSASGADAGGAGASGGSFTGSATLRFAGRTETFTLEPCVSATEQSIQGAGRTADGKWSLSLEVDGGTGEVTMSDVTDQMSVVLDGKAETLTVSDDGSFTGSGTAVFDLAETPFELSGTCNTLNWR